MMINKISMLLSEGIKLRLNSSDNEKEVYAYSIEVLLSLLLNLTFLAIAAYILKKPTELVIFIIFFSGLRIYAGGYHAKSHIECFSISLFIFIISAISNTYLKLYGELILIIGILFSMAIIFVFAPSESSNKPLSKKERLKYKIFSRIIVVVLSIGALCLYFTREINESIYITAAVSMSIESLSLLKK
ncbi:MAG: accessory gene regulator ArgB-like protein [Sedimentibacter sp.]